MLKLTSSSHESREINHSSKIEHHITTYVVIGASKVLEFQNKTKLSPSDLDEYI